MPYIKMRDKFDVGLVFVNPETEGDLNYCISSLIHKYILENKLSYATINTVVGVLECAKLEAYRQIAAPYENQKKLENGNISKLDEKTLEDVR
jgi:hypothetical protein